MTNGIGALRAIPSLAIMAAMLPLIGVGFRPALIALTILAIPPMLINTQAGIMAVNPAITEAARGMGLSRWQIIGQVQLPLALPIILAGVRIAAISTIAIATVAAFFDAGGLGALIREGISQDYSDKIWAGVLAVTLLAILFEQSLRVITRWLHHGTADNQRVA